MTFFVCPFLTLFDTSLLALSLADLAGGTGGGAPLAEKNPLSSILRLPLASLLSFIILVGSFVRESLSS